MGPNRDATNIIYAAGGMLILSGLVQLENSHRALGVACLVMGPVLIIQPCSIENANAHTRRRCLGSRKRSERMARFNPFLPLALLAVPTEARTGGLRPLQATARAVIVIANSGRCRRSFRRLRSRCAAPWRNAVAAYRLP